MLRINRVLTWLAFLIIAIVSGGVPSAVYAKLVKLPVMVAGPLDSKGTPVFRLQFFNFAVSDTSPLLNQKCDNTICSVKEHMYMRQYIRSSVSWSSSSWGTWMVFNSGNKDTLYTPQKDETVGEFLDEQATLSVLTGYKSTPTSGLSANYQVCPAIFYSDEVMELVGYKKFTTADATASGACATTGQEIASCSFKTSAATFNYGTIDKAKASGITSRQNITVSCSGDASVTLSYADRGQSIVLSNGMAAQLTVNGDQIGDGKEMDLTSGEHNWEIVSTLEGTPESSGPFDGSSVLNINVL